jgi:hypothetical protein
VGPKLDLSELDSVDLASLRLGAQVMSHKAELAARPCVETFFKALQLTVDEELARRKQTPDEKPLVSAAELPLAGLASTTAPPTDEDRTLAAEYLDLLHANARLSEPVRHAVRTLRRQLGPDY